MYFVEYLPRLKSLSITVGREYYESLKSIRKISVRENQWLLLGDDGGNEILIKLPIKLEQDEKIQLNGANRLDDMLCLNMTIPNYEETISDKTESFMEFAGGNKVLKWSCKDLKIKTPVLDNLNQFEFCCKGCGGVVCGSGTHSQFRDMPSEFWSEMMEFWHCHKPGHNHHQEGRKYEGDIQPGKEEIVIGSDYILLKTHETLVVASLGVSCASCGQKLGEIKKNGTIKIYKWNLKLKYLDQSEEFAASLNIYYAILDAVNLSAARRFDIRNETNYSAIFVWVFNIGLAISTPDTSLTNAFKILYRYVKTGDESNEKLDVETLIVQDEVYNDFKEQIETFNAKLPEQNKYMSFKEEEGEEIQDGDGLTKYRVGFLGELFR